MSSLVFGIIINYDDHYKLNNGKDISGWDLIHNYLEQYLRNIETNLGLYAFGQKNYCLVSKVWNKKQQQGFLKIPVEEMYEYLYDDNCSNKLEMFEIVWKELGIKFKTEADFLVI